MCGCNSMEEMDRHPLALCPECLPKICMAVNADPVTRFRSLAEFCRTNGLSEEAAFCDKSLDALAKPASRVGP